MSQGRKSLSEKTALITGAAKRLGRAMALALAKQGVNCVIHYHQSQEAAESLRKEINDIGVTSWLLAVDLGNADQTKSVIGKAIDLAGPLDMLINNASIFPADTLADISYQAIQENMAIHTWAPLELARQFANQGQPGHIINMLDSRVNDYDKAHLAYHLSKRTLQSLTRIMALEYAPQISVNAVAPGLILPPAGHDDSYLHNLAHTNPLNTFGSVNDISEAVLFLLQSPFITGQTIYVDGGRHLKGHMYE